MDFITKFTTVKIYYGLLTRIHPYGIFTLTSKRLRKRFYRGSMDNHVSMADIAENGTQEIPDNGEYIDLDVTLAVVDAVAQ